MSSLAQARPALAAGALALAARLIGVAILGAGGALELSPSIRGALLGFAAGAMLFVVSHEIIPETHRKGHQLPATLGVMGGFAVMMVLDNAFA